MAIECRIGCLNLLTRRVGGHTTPISDVGSRDLPASDADYAATASSTALVRAPLASVHCRVAIAKA